jgi:diaminopimelate epimerase
MTRSTLAEGEGAASAIRAGLRGIPFVKMTGSGNDFVFLDGRDARLRALETAPAIERLCARGTGIGADGVVWLCDPVTPGSTFRMRYRNSDGSIADMCGNAALCSIALAVQEGLAPAGRAFSFDTDSGVLSGRLADGVPEVTLPPIHDLRPDVPIPRIPGEWRIGFANSGVPHLVVSVEKAEEVQLDLRGAELRRHPALGRDGANVDFLSRTAEGRWRMRTYERGVEGETLACGTGAAACGALLRAWGAAPGTAAILTTSGSDLIVRLEDSDGQTRPRLSGLATMVFRGVTESL